MTTSRRNNIPNVRLTKRLAAAAAAVREGRRVVDVGCDHGKLAAFLIVSGKCPRVCAVDLSPRSLEKAKALFALFGIDGKAETLLSDGLSRVDGREADDVVIAGLGCDVTARIIKDARWLKDGDKRLVLAPSSRYESLRSYLYAEGFYIVSERAVAESGHMYAVMTVAYGGVKRQISAAFAAFGKTLDFDGDKDEYIEYVARKNRMLIEEIGNARAPDLAKMRAAAGILRFIDKIGER